MRFDWKYGPAETYSDSKFQNAISQIHWYCTLYADNGSTFKMSDSVMLGPPNSATFVPFDKVTESMVTSWVFNKVNLTEVQAALTAEYNNSLNPTTKHFNY